MRLIQPTDFDILEVFEAGRNVATNVAGELDHDRAYINTRLPHLFDHKLVERIGPASHSGLYELTGRGRAVIACRDEYTDLGAEGFEELVEQQL